MQLLSAAKAESDYGVVIGAPLGLRVGVYQRSGQPRQRMQQAVLGVDRDLVRPDGAGTQPLNHSRPGGMRPRPDHRR